MTWELVGCRLPGPTLDLRNLNLLYKIPRRFRGMLKFGKHHGT